MTQETLAELAERCEKASGPDAMLDEQIAFWCYQNGGIAGVNYDPVMWLIRHGGEFTSSIDFATQLVPKGWWWSAGECSVSADASVGPDVAHCDKDLLIAFDDGIHADLPQPSTPALALCVASLKAHAALRARLSIQGGGE